MALDLDAVTACLEHRVTFSETDALGYVHHSCAAVWFERAREEYFRKFGVPFVELAKAGVFMAMRKLEVQYDSFIGYDDLLRFRTGLTMLGRVHLDFHLRVDNLTRGTVGLHAKANLVAIEAKVPGQPPQLSRIAFDRAAFLPRVLRVDQLIPPGP